MSVAHDLNALEEQKRKEAARNLVSEAFRRVQALRRRSDFLEAGHAPSWEEAGVLANDLIRAAGPLDLGLLVACAKEVLHFTTRRASGAPLEPNLALYLVTGLDTLALELERLRSDKGLR